MQFTYTTFFIVQPYHLPDPIWQPDIVDGEILDWDDISQPDPPPDEPYNLRHVLLKLHTGDTVSVNVAAAMPAADAYYARGYSSGVYNVVIQNGTNLPPDSLNFGLTGPGTYDLVTGSPRQSSALSLTVDPNSAAEFSISRNVLELPSNSPTSVDLWTYPTYARSSFTIPPDIFDHDPIFVDGLELTQYILRVTVTVDNPTRTVAPPKPGHFDAHARAQFAFDAGVLKEISNAFSAGVKPNTPAEAAAKSCVPSGDLWRR